MNVITVANLSNNHNKPPGNCFFPENTGQALSNDRSQNLAAVFHTPDDMVVDVTDTGPLMNVSAHITNYTPIARSCQQLF